MKVKKRIKRHIKESITTPKPHQNTVATILKILVEKEFVNVKTIGRQYQYYPAVSKQKYSKDSMKSLVKGYFGGSFSEAVSFMVKENNISMEELEMLLQQIKNNKK